MIIEKATLRDLNSLSTMYFQLMGEKVNLSKMKEIFSQIDLNDRYYLLVARDSNGEAIGTVMGILCYELTCQCRPFMLIENVVVMDSHRGMGIGESLLSELESIAKMHNCGYVMLVSDNERTRSHRFYEKVGYTTAKGYKKIYY